MTNTPALTAEQRAKAAWRDCFTSPPVEIIASAIREAEQAVLVEAAADIRSYADNHHARSTHRSALMSAIVTVEQYAARRLLKSQKETP